MQKKAHSRGLSVEIPSAWEEKIIVSQRFPLDNMGSYLFNVKIDESEKRWKRNLLPSSQFIQFSVHVQTIPFCGDY